MIILHNFNHERFVICAATTRMARLCYEESIEYAMVRKTFGTFFIVAREEI
jgi:alkylation response protein AidB-like acyl-CoA dehydrogenase